MRIPNSRNPRTNDAESIPAALTNGRPIVGVVWNAYVVDYGKACDITGSVLGRDAACRAPDHNPERSPHLEVFGIRRELNHAARMIPSVARPEVQHRRRRRQLVRIAVHLATQPLDLGPEIQSHAVHRLAAD